MKNEFSLIVYLLALIFTAFAFVTLLILDYNSCQKIGGEFIRGLFWFKCLK